MSRLILFLRRLPDQVRQLRTALLLLVLATLGSALAAPSYCTATWAITSATTKQIGYFNFTTNTYTAMYTAAGTNVSSNSLSESPSNGRLYYIDRTNNQLRYVNPVDGSDNLVASVVAPPAAFVGGTFDASGNYYVNTSNGKFAQMDVATGAIIGAYKTMTAPAGYTLNATSNGDFAIDGTGQMYVIVEATVASVNNPYIWKLDLNSGALTSPLAIKSNATTQWTGTANGLAIDPPTGALLLTSGTGALAGGTAGGIFAVDAVTGIATLKQGSTVFTDLGSCGLKPDLPTLSKSFSPTPISAAPGISKLTITIGNTNLAPIYTFADLTDTLPTTPGAMKVAATPNLTGTCLAGNTVTAAGGATSIKLSSGARIPVGGCTITVDVTAPSYGTYVNTIAASSLVTSVGTHASAASATLENLQPTLILNKTIAAPGRANTADQFTVQVKSGATVTASASTSGSGTTAATATTSLNAGTAYTLTEVMAAGSVSALSNYTTAVSCANSRTTSSTVLPSGAGQSFTLTPAAGDAITCTLTNTPTLADLAVTKTASKASYAAGEDVVYTVTLTNNGPAAAGGAVLTDTLPTQIIAASWTCSGSGGAVCPAASGNGNLSQTVATLPSSGSVSYTITGLARTSGTGIVNTASVALPSGVSDLSPANNSASATIAIVNPAAASYTGPGAMAPYTTCLNFNGMPVLTPGNSWTNTVTSPDGVALTYTVKVLSVSMAGTSGTPAATDGLEPYVPGTWQGDRWQLYFGANLKNALSNNPGSRDVTYSVSAYALIGSLPVPLQLVTGSAEEDGANGGDPARPIEFVQSTTNGTSFGLADVVTTGGPFRRVTVSGGGKTITTSASSLDAAGANTQVNIALFSTQKRATAADPLVLTSRMLGSGKTAQGFCAEFYADRGDAPTSYGAAAHYTDTTYNPLLPDGTYLYDQLTIGARTDSTTLWLGPAKPSVESAPRGTNALGDSDDAVSSFPPLTSANTYYNLNLTCSNLTGVTATIAAWFDFNANGTFESGERASSSCPVGGGTFTLSWPSVGSVPLGTTYARIRISTDVPSTNSATGPAPDGEVEDYAITVTVGADLRAVKVGPAYARPGDTLTYTITVTNLSGATPATTTVTDTLPAGLSYVSSTPAASVSGQTLSWSVASLASGASRTYTVVATAPTAAALSSTPALRTQTNSVGVSSPLTDPFPVDNTGTATTAMVYGNLVKRVRNVTQGGAFGTSGSGLPGEVLEYCIDYSNLGGAALPNFAISDQVPGNTTPLPLAYDADEPSATTGFGVKLLRGAVTSYLSSVTDADAGALSLTGGSFGRGAMTATLGTLAVGEAGSACFQATIR
ncbi:GEVED domain-containing protein [Deinococcus koreensis]|uniref:DUF7933 domain-containing protein n=1 Tax=Deinococcus koreensis TaxID=2054903 RepID=UPI0010571335|nr:GEVED domain-containing protein [Deinococcus koreensis]